MTVRSAVVAGLFALALAAGLTAYSGAAIPDGPQFSAGKDSEYWPAVKACLEAWGDTHPFKDDSKARFRILDTSVKVFGIGADISDTDETNDPQLILVRPGVNVMGKLTFHLMNPKGWYCFEKTEVTVACTAQVASAGPGDDPITVAPGKGGTTVMGKTTFERKCK
jgi:hypothetical protein